jgi:hypothetical protein
MTLTPIKAKKLDGTETYLYEGMQGYALELPGKPHLALRFRK